MELKNNYKFKIKSRLDGSILPVQYHKVNVCEHEKVDYKALQELCEGQVATIQKLHKQLEKFKKANKKRRDYMRNYMRSYRTHG